MGRGWVRGFAIGPCHLKRGELVVPHIVADPRNRTKRLVTKGWRPSYGRKGNRFPLRHSQTERETFTSSGFSAVQQRKAAA